MVNVIHVLSVLLVDVQVHMIGAIIHIQVVQTAQQLMIRQDTLNTAAHVTSVDINILSGI